MGCIEDKDTIIYNSNYPNFTITNFPYETFPYFGYESMNLSVTIKSSDPQKTSKMANGTIIFYGDVSTQPVSMNIEGIGNITQNVTMAYNESKTIYFSFNLGVNPYGDHIVTISTPTMHIQRKIFIFNGKV
jgi:hypothetical protein